MAREMSRLERLPRETRNALADYLAELEGVKNLTIVGNSAFPAAIGRVYTPF